MQTWVIRGYTVTKVHNRMVGLAINTSELWKENED